MRFSLHSQFTMNKHFMLHRCWSTKDSANFLPASSLLNGEADEADALRSATLELSAAAVAASDTLRSNTLFALMNWDSKFGTVDGEFFVVLPYFSIYRIVIMLLCLILTGRIFNLISLLIHCNNSNPLLPSASNEDAEEVAVTGDFRVDVFDGLSVADFSRS